MNEDLANRQRQKLGRLFGKVLAHVDAAQRLLAHKARTSPRSAEADAHKQLLEVQYLINAWAIDAGEAIDIPYPPLNPLTGSNHETTHPERLGGNHLPPGPEAAQGPAAH